MDYVLIQPPALRRWATELIQRGGSAEAEAAIVSDHLLRANLAGHDSHGVGMLPAYVKNLQAGLLKPNQPAKLIKDDGAILIFDGQWGYGQRVAQESMAAAIARARASGVVVMALRQAHHIGRVGTYGEQSVAAGMVSLHFVNVTGHDPLVAPFGGAEGRFITNPLCFAMPGTAKTEPIVLDMATSRIAAGKVRVAKNKGVPLPESMMIDPEGRPTTDPNVLFQNPKGALLPFGEYKGYGLALFCELLAGALGAGLTIHPGNERHHGIVNGMLTIVIDPQRLVEQTWLHQEIDALIDYVKSARPADSANPVMIAGEPERKAKAQRERDGIPIDATTWEELLIAGERVGFTRAEARALAGVTA